MSALDPIKRRRGRPPKGTSDPNATRESLLRAGVETLTEKGFSNAGIDEILRRVGVPKGSFYHYFAHKEAFGSALIEHYHRYFMSKLERHFNDSSLRPLQRIYAFIEDAAHGMQRYDFQRGCLIGNLGQELGSLPEPYRRQLADVFSDWQRVTERCLSEAKTHGEISDDQDCEHLSRIFWIGWEGAVMRAKLDRSTRALSDFARYFIQSIQHQSTTSGDINV